MSNFTEYGDGQAVRTDRIDALMVEYRTRPGPYGYVFGTWYLEALIAGYWSVLAQGGRDECESKYAKLTEAMA